MCPYVVLVLTWEYCQTSLTYGLPPGNSERRINEWIPHGFYLPTVTVFLTVRQVYSFTTWYQLLAHFQVADGLE